MSQDVYKAKYVRTRRGYLILVEIAWNSWHSKTYCRHADCDLELEAYERAIEAARQLMEEMERAAGWPRRPPVITVGAWRHYCGALPRWYYLKAVLFFDHTGLPETGAICVEGGTSWRACLVYRHGALRVYSDGCWRYEDIRDIIYKDVAKPETA